MDLFFPLTKLYLSCGLVFSAFLAYNVYDTMGWANMKPRHFAIALMVHTFIWPVTLWHVIRAQFEE